jgi:DNA-binding response OmpR family regulator
MLNGRVALVVDCGESGHLIQPLTDRGLRVIQVNSDGPASVIVQNLRISIAIVFVGEKKILAVRDRIASIRRDLQDCPIIVITPVLNDEVRSACLEAGASDLVSLQRSSDELLSIVRVWLFE